MRMLSAVGILLLGLWLTGCGALPTAPLAQATPLPTPAVVPLPALLGELPRWSGQQLELIALLVVRDGTRVLALGADPSPAAAVWLAEPPPAAIATAARAGPVLVRAAGRLSPAGAYGTGQRYPYQFSATRLELLHPERTTLANLALNPQALDRLPLRVEGVLLARPGEALLVERVSQAGVPASDARQIKLAPLALDEAVMAHLTRAGEVAWGAVVVEGWWQAGVLTPLRISTRSAP